MVAKFDEFDPLNNKFGIERDLLDNNRFERPPGLSFTAYRTPSGTWRDGPFEYDQNGGFLMVHVPRDMQP